MLEEVASQCKEIGAADVLVVTADATDIQQCQCVFAVVFC